MIRAVLIAGVLALALGWCGEAAAADECNGLDVCISVPGPWVAVPGAESGTAETVYYQLSCPRRTVVGGLDAVLGDRALDVRFLGALGSPVNPGITTSREAVFVATYARSRATYFRPFLGCIPTSGGGGRGTTSVAAVAPAQPPVRRVRSLRLRRGAAQRLIHACRAGERLVGSSHAIAFWTRSAPSAAALGGVDAVPRVRRSYVEVRARRSSAVPARARVELQVHALCAKGPA